MLTLILKYAGAFFWGFLGVAGTLMVRGAFAWPSSLMECTGAGISAVVLTHAHRPVVDPAKTQDVP